MASVEKKKKSKLPNYHPGAAKFVSDRYSVKPAKKKKVSKLTSAARKLMKSL